MYPLTTLGFRQGSLNLKSMESDGCEENEKFTSQYPTTIFALFSVTQGQMPERYPIRSDTLELDDSNLPPTSENPARGQPVRHRAGNH